MRLAKSWGSTGLSGKQVRDPLISGLETDAGPVSSNSTNLGFAFGILTSKQYGVVSKALKQQKLQILSARPVTTFSGREIRISTSQHFPMLKFVPTVLPDGVRINLTAKISSNAAMLKAGLEARDREGVATIYDSQTAVLSTESLGRPGRRWVCFVTVTLIDPAGRPVHSKEELLFTNESIPPQEAEDLKE